MTTAKPTYAELLKEVSITITPNDAAFLSAILGTYIYQNKQEQNEYLVNLCKALNPRTGC